MERERRERGSRTRTGICINEECELCASKTKQVIRQGHDFVCEKCGKELRECREDPKGSKSKIIGGIAALIVLGGIGGGVACFTGGSDEKTETVVTEKAETVETKDTVKAEEVKAVEEVATIAAPEGSIDLGYAFYTGKMKDGKMNDANGVLLFKEKHIIESRDIKKREAKAGEKVIGIFEDGHLTTGTWIKKDGNKETIIP